MRPRKKPMTKFTPQLYRILAVDDSNVTLHMVEMALGRAGFQVETALSGEDALSIIQEQGLPHMALVDINMPFGMDGFEFCEAVHEFSDLPIIMLTAVDESDTIVQAIEQYAEDYITKPVSAGELVARVRRLLRTIGHFPFELAPVTIVDEILSVNFTQSEVYVNGQTNTLTPTETKLLYIMMRSAGRLMTADFLLKRLWPLENAFEDRLRVYIHRLRTKIETDSQNPRYIVSRRGRGYIFMPNGSNA